MRSPRDAEMNLRLGNPQLAEERTGHGVVEVLSGVKQSVAEVLAERGDQGRCFHELGSSAHHGEDIVHRPSLNRTRLRFPRPTLDRLGVQ